MKLDILLGLQWGDEGKGKVVDLLSGKYDVVARFQGGPNAGHSLEFEQEKHVLHIIPSGVFRPDTVNVIGNGMVIDPVVFKTEIENIEKAGYNPRQKILISRKAHLILPSHRILDAASESAKGKEKIGSTLKGIGPTYMDKTGRNGMRIGDIESPDFKQRYNVLVRKHKEILRLYDFSYNLADHEAEWFEGIELLKQFPLVDGEYFLNKALDDDKKVLAEGAQGTLLDIDYGSYPYVTSSNTISSGASTGLGIGPKRIGEVYGIFKAYCTRVGSGPFPTELQNETGKKLQEAGNEFGATTGRPRRCGWLDLPALDYAAMINGVTDLVITKADVFKGFEEIKVCEQYLADNKPVKFSTFNLKKTNLEFDFKAFKGWEEDISLVEDFEKLPQSLKEYLNFIAQSTGRPISVVSTSADRKGIIFKDKNMFN